MTNELKPCPFCGQAARTWHDEHSDYTKHHRWMAGCQPDFRASHSCPIEPNTYEDFKTEAEAIAAWNRRANSGGEVDLPSTSLERGLSDALYKYKSTLADTSAEGWRLFWAVHDAAFWLSHKAGSPVPTTPAPSER